ncbi:hypothetical protein EV421DRAFT_1912596 [Armillaria borealis]|uniref:Uncharacterized protein n=1 Tax=Armillaria borealis TaxID=47425 RepID=A0AA39IXI8_9AGAR|nr:hypothetical protein EV421DRAFT_1912596 [Armillaria borealis]
MSQSEDFLSTTWTILLTIIIQTSTSTTSVSDISADLNSKGTTTSSSKVQDVKASGASTATGCSVDRLNLRNGIRSDSQLAELRRRKKKAAMVKYQNRQNDPIVYLLKPLELHTSYAKDEKESARLWVKVAVWASLISKVALCVIQMYAAISLHLKAEKLDMNKWPVDGTHLENIENIVYGPLMSSVNLIVVVNP